MTVRPMQTQDLEGVLALQRCCFPPPFSTEFLWRREHLEAHLAKFDEGQFVALSGDKVIGSASNNLISEMLWEAHASWEETNGGWEFDSFDPSGTTLYGADISVHPAHRGQGVGRALYTARFELVRKRNLTRFGTACRLPDFSSSSYSGLKDYANSVAEGTTVDRTLTPLLRYGLRLITVLQDYMDDPESGNGAALLEWTP